jgi:alpha-tubulin suppressor-like RCC1 family protein
MSGITLRFYQRTPDSAFRHLAVDGGNWVFAGRPCCGFLAMNNLSPHFRARFTFPSGASAAKTRCRGRLTVAVCIAVALFSAKPISGVDQNGDGMSDVWQQQYSVPSTDADLDYSGTGLTNRQKSVVGLDPRNPSARFHLDIVNDFSSNQLRLQLNTVAGKRYQIESSTDLRSWVALNSPISGTGQPAEITLPLPQPPIFFRASYAGDIDADGDGLTAWEENLLGTDDNNADSDNDGMPDAWEYSHGLNPIVNDANNDLDGDGTTNLQEYQAGTDPNDYYNNQAPNLIIVSGDRQSGSLNSFLASPLIVKITNSQNQPLANAPVTFSAPSGSGELSTSTSGTPLSSAISVRTSTDGSAAIYFKLSSNPPSDISITATAGTTTATLTARYVPIPPLSIISGDRQQGLPGKLLPAPFVVRLVDAAGQPTANAPVTFSIVSGDGALTVQPLAAAVSTSITRNTNEEGLAWLYYIQGSTTEVTSLITASGSNGQVSFSSTTSIPPVTAKSIAVGSSHALALYSDGTIWCWGANSRGQLGDGTTTSRWHRAQVLDLASIIAVATHADTSAALRADATVWTWGSNSYSALGNGTTVNQSTVPVQVLQDPSTPLTDVVAIASGYLHYLALKSDGTVWAWGADWAYQLGNSSGNNSAFALPVLLADGSPLHDIVSIACGDDYNLALKADGSVWAWGYNSYRQLGSSDTIWARAAPGLVTGLTNVIAVAGGAYHSLALKSDGTVWSWGRNTQGCLGNGSATGTQATPGQVADFDHVIAIAAAKTHSLALKSDGTVWSWGDNSAGQLGVGTSPNKSLSPVQTQNLSAIIAIAAAGSQNMALAVNGSLFGWGANESGQLGNSPLTTETLPTIVRDFLFIEDPDHDGLVTWKELSLGGNPNAYSTAGDTISDGWKASYSLNLTDVNLTSQDPTGKGLTILQDFQIGTDPTKFSTVDDGIADGWKVRYGLDPFDRALADKDPSRKGWAVRMDYQLGTDPTKISTLNDGIPDKWKVDHHANPLDSSYATGDADQDGLSNAEEYTAGTDPENPDTDSDGFFDGPDGWATDADLHPPRLPEYQYAVIDLGDGTARAINNQNQVIGDNEQGFFWEEGLRQDFPVHGNGNDYAVGINDSGTALFDHNDGPPTLRRPDGTEVSLQFIGANERFDFDPNIVYSVVESFSGAGISNSGYVAAAFNWRGSWVGAYGGLARAAIWTTNYSSPILLDTVPDANDRILAVDDTQRHNFVKDYENTVESFNFGGRYDNRRGLDNVMYRISMNNSGQIVANTSNQDSVDEWGFPFYGLQFQTITLWTNNQPETVAKASFSPLQAFAINDDTVIGGINETGHENLWVKVNGTWKEKDLGLWSDNSSDMRINRNLQVTRGHLLYQNQRLIDLNTRIPQTYTNLRGLGINEAGLIVGQADDRTDPNQIRQRAVLLVSAELIVDGNRDGQMSFDDPNIHDADQTKKDKPYRFWLNNDHDEERTVDGDDREQDDYDESPDFNNPAIFCERDLEDWSRLWISFEGIAGLIKSPGVTVELAWKPTDGGTTWPASDGDPGIKVMLHDSLAGAGAVQSTYLTESSEASAQAHGLWAGVIKPVSKSGGYTLTNDFLQFVSEDTPYLYLLFEGWTAGKGQLVLTIKKDGQKIGEYPPVYLELKDVKEMYERYTIGDVQDANTSVLSSIDYQNWPATHAILMPAPSGQPLAAPPDETKDYVLWVHGWNMSPFDKDSFGDTAFKRLFWQGYKGRFGTFRWPTFYFTGDAPPVHQYDASEHRAWASSLGLLALLNQLNSGPFAGKVRVMAHSMGNVVASEALRRAQSGQVVHTYIASQAAMPAHCYDATTPLMAYSSGLGPTTPNVYGYYWQDNATSQPHEWQAEGRPSYMHPGYMSGKAGRYFNYYNDTDWALNGFHWQLDQQTKPDSDYGYEYAGLGSSTGFWQDRGLGATWLTFPNDRHEIFAWAAEPRSYALGSQWVEGVVTGSTGASLDLKQPPISYDREHKYHSGQFRGMNMERRHYWERLLIDCGLKETQ